MEQSKVTLGQEKLILGHKEMKYGTERGDFLGQEKLTYGHNKTNFGTERGVFLDRRGRPQLPRSAVGVMLGGPPLKLSIFCLKHHF